MIKVVRYKLELIFLKILPILLALFYFVSNIFGLFHISFCVFRYIGYLSFLPMIFILLSSKVFNFCITHRLPIYYILIIDIINMLIYFSIITVTNKELLVIYSLLTGILIVSITIIKLKKNVKHNKESIIKSD